MFLICLGKEVCGITEEAQSVALTFATRNKTVALAGNGALLNKRFQYVYLFVLNVANMYVLNTRTLSGSILLGYYYYYWYHFYFRLCFYLQLYLRFVLLYLFIGKRFGDLCLGYLYGTHK